jgi:predicted 2-oxoglutarate/Fe(II)-dependent dioxygenase YbiX
VLLPCAAFLPAFAYDDLGYARAIHLVHPQVVTVEDELVADLGGTPELSEDETADGVEVLALETRGQRLVDLPQGGAAVYRV